MGITDRGENEKRKALISEYPEPQRILLQFESNVQKYNKSIYFRTLAEQEDKNKTLKFKTDPPRSFFGNIVYLREELNNLLNDDWSIFVFAESDNQALRIEEILHEDRIKILPYNLSSGFGIPDLKILVIHENR